MMCAEGSREPSAGAMECDIVDSIMRTDRDWRVGVVTWWDSWGRRGRDAGRDTGRQAGR